MTVSCLAGVGLAPTAEPEALRERELREHVCARLGEKGRKEGLGKGDGVMKQGCSRGFLTGRKAEVAERP